MQIHFIWLQGWEELPARFSANIDSWKRFAQAYGHTIRTWDTHQIEKLLPTEELRQVYSDYPIFVQRADMGRYLILARHGGLYLDVDVFIPEASFDDFQAQLEAVPAYKVGMPSPHGVPYLGVAPLDGKIRNWCIYSPLPGQPLFRALLREMPSRLERQPQQLRSYYVAWSTGSVLITDVLNSMTDPEMWHPLEIDPLVDNQYASTWGGIFYYDSQDWILILALGIVIVVVLVCVCWYWSGCGRDAGLMFSGMKCHSSGHRSRLE